jgi:hypothetical protein
VCGAMALKIKQLDLVSFYTNFLRKEEKEQWKWNLKLSMRSWKNRRNWRDW